MELPALQVQPPNIPSPLTSYMKMLQTRNLVQQNKSGDLQLQQQQQQADDEKAYRAVLQKHNGDMKAALPEIMQVAPRKGLEIQKSLAEWDKLDTEGKIK